MFLNDEYFSCSSDEYESAKSNNSSLSDCDTLDKKLMTVFDKNSKFLSLVHINAQSIAAHHNDLLSSFGDGVVDCILVSETWLKPSLPSTSCSLPGYKLFRNDRTGRGGGGVGIYLRGHIPASVVSCSPSQYTCSIEYIFLEIIIHHKKILLGALYSPNDQIDYFKNLEDTLENLVPLFDYVILMGDLNTCLLKNDNRARNLTNAVSSLNLHVLQMSSPTHYSPNCRPSLLDLMIVSNPNFVVSHGQMTAPFSYHDLIFLSFKVRPPKIKSKVLFQRNFRHMDLDRLREDLRCMDWSPIFLSDDIDFMTNYLTVKLTNIFDTHAPVRPVRIKHIPAPWLTPVIKRVMAKRDKAKSQNKKTPTPDNLQAYKKLRNICNRMCRDAKRKYIHMKIESVGQKHVWSFLKTLGVGKPTVSCQNSVDLNALNSYFSTPPLILDRATKSASLAFLLGLAPPDCPSFSFSTVSEDDIKRSICSITTKAVGSDGLSMDMILPVLEDIAPVVTFIINFSLTRNVFPVSWKKAYVIPLPKNPNPSAFSQYRPISILPILSKVLESVTHKQLYSFLASNSLLCPFQSGFRPSHSTVGALLNITEDIRWAMDNTKLTAMVLLDFSSAFNSVDFDLLLGTLRSVNVSEPVLKWFRSYLYDRMQCVKHHDVSSDWISLSAGVPQGGVLSPLLFSVFINKISSVISSPFHLYADDLQIYRHFMLSEIVETIQALNLDLSAVQAWAKSFGLIVNPAKSQAMIVGSGRLRGRLDWSSIPALFYDSVPIKYADRVKNLGLTLDCDMSWSAHISEISKRLHFSFHSLKRLQYFLPFQTKIMLAQSLLLPILDYADVCYLDVTEEQLLKLERLQNLAIRFIFGLRKYDHVSHFRTELKWLPIRHRRNVHILSNLYNILNDPNSPSYLRSRFQLLPPPCRSKRACITKTLEIPKVNTNFLLNSFTVKAAQLWNRLPTNIQDSSSIISFKKKVKDHFLSLKSSQ